MVTSGNLCSVIVLCWLNVRSNCIVLADNGQMTGSLYKGASSEALLCLESCSLLMVDAYPHQGHEVLA